MSASLWPSTETRSFLKVAISRQTSGPAAAKHDSQCSSLAALNRGGLNRGLPEENGGNRLLSRGFCRVMQYNISLALLVCRNIPHAQQHL